MQISDFLRKNTKISHFRREISLRQIGVTWNLFSPKRFYHGMRGCAVRQDDGKHVERFFITLQPYTILGIPSFGRFPSLVGFTLIFGFSRKIHQKIMRLLTFLKDRVQLHYFFPENPSMSVNPTREDMSKNRTRQSPQVYKNTFRAFLTIIRGIASLHIVEILFWKTKMTQIYFSF